jgi:Leucine-rich repeat (LRR) protein
MSDPFEEQEPAGVGANSNKANETRNGVATLVNASEVNPDPFYPFHDSVTDAAVVGLLHSSVTRINLAGCRLVTDETLRAIALHCKSLKAIIVAFCRDELTDSGLVNLVESCQQLKSIDVSDCVNLTDDTIHAVARHCKSLESINVRGCGYLRDGGLVDLVESCRHLKSINFRKTRLSQLPENIGNLKNLRYLNISQSNISKLPRSIANLPPDCRLNVNGNPLS